MLRSHILAVIMLASSSIFAEEMKFKNSEEKISYLIGRNIGDGLRQDGVEVNMDLSLIHI